MADKEENFVCQPMQVIDCENLETVSNRHGTYKYVPVILDLPQIASGNTTLIMKICDLHIRFPMPPPISTSLSDHIPTPTRVLTPKLKPIKLPKPPKHKKHVQKQHMPKWQQRM